MIVRGKSTIRHMNVSVSLPYLALDQVLFYLDKEIGRFVGELDKKGWLENSIIVVASDNGGCPTNGGTNYPLRGIKHSYWDGGNKVRCGLVLSYPVR